MNARKSIWLAACGLAVCLMTAQFVEAQQAGRKRPQRQRRGGRAPDLLKVGDKAPDFTLKTLDGKSEVTLSSFQGKKPVMLIFGSYT